MDSLFTNLILIKYLNTCAVRVSIYDVLCFLSDMLMKCLVIILAYFLSHLFSYQLGKNILFIV